MRRALAICLTVAQCVPIAACGGDDDGGNGTVDAPAGPDAQAMVTVSGVAQTVSGTNIVPLADATIEAFNSAGGGSLGSTTSGADGAYSITLETGGSPLNGYLRGTSAGRLDTYLYPPRPLAADRPGATMLIISQSTLDLLGLLVGTEQDPAKGFVGVIVIDANNTAVSGATVSITPAGSARVLYAVDGLPDADAVATDASGTVFVANTNVGEVSVDATMGATDFFAHAVNARAGVITTTAVQAQ